MRYHLYLIHILIEIKNKRNTRTFFTQLWETNFNTSKFNKEEISDDEIELKLLYTQKLYRELKELNNFFEKYQSLMFKDTYIEPY